MFTQTGKFFSVCHTKPLRDPSLQGPGVSERKWTEHRFWWRCPCVSQFCLSNRDVFLCNQNCYLGGVAWQASSHLLKCSHLPVRLLRKNWCKGYLSLVAQEIASWPEWELSHNFQIIILSLQPSFQAHRPDGLKTDFSYRGLCLFIILIHSVAGSQ